MREYSSGLGHIGQCKVGQAQRVGSIVDTCSKMGEPPTEKPSLQPLKAVRAVIVIPILMNVNLVALAVYVAKTKLHSTYPKAVVADVIFLASVAFMRVIWLISNGCMQAVTASVMIAKKAECGSKSNEGESGIKSNEGKSDSESNEMDQRRWYKRWLWWNRFGTLVLILQVVAACCMVDHIQSINEKRLQTLLMVLPVATLAVVMLGWFTGSEVMSWRSLYKSNDAWMAHYREVFDYCIREALCCMCRYGHLARTQKEEIHSIATLLGKLVSYRAQGCSHLEVLAGVSLLRGHTQRSQLSGNQKPAPEARLREASILHPYAVAAYTGPLLEIGRYPFCCWLFVWLYNQGFCSFWKRSRIWGLSNGHSRLSMRVLNYRLVYTKCSHCCRRPVLEGDNFWRGHAAAFLRHARLPPEALRKGSVLQKTERESAYFVVVLHELRTVLVAVRGTETPEDLLTDGLSKESPLSESDLLGLLTGPQVSEEVKRLVKETWPHHAHSGIIEAARKLAKQLDNLADDDHAASDMASTEGHKENELPNEQGFLSKLLGPKGECEGYHLRIVGHSLGGAISALTGLRLYRRYPDLHVYAFGVLPCVDNIIAEACQEFITSVGYHDEFSCRLSVASVTRLCANALEALSNDTKSTTVKKTQVVVEGQRSSIYSSSSDSQSSMSPGTSSSNSPSAVDTAPAELIQRRKWSELSKMQRLPYRCKGGLFLCAHTCYCVCRMPHHHKATSISSEVERAVRDLSKQQNGSKSQWPCMGKCMDGNHDPELMTRLVPPVPVALNGIHGVTEGKECITGTGKGHRVVIDIEAQSNEGGEEATGESSGHDFQKLTDLDLQFNGMPKKMGSGFSNDSGDDASQKVKDLWPAEMFLPGLVIHIRREEKPAASWGSSFCYSWQAEEDTNYRALVVDRNEFRDFVISPSMFVDHMPWKCQRALNLIVEQLNQSNRASSLDNV